MKTRRTKRKTRRKEIKPEMMEPEALMYEYERLTMERVDGSHNMTPKNFKRYCDLHDELLARSKHSFFTRN